MYWQLLLFRKPDANFPGYKYWKFAIKTQPSPDYVLSKITSILMNNNFEQSPNDCEKWCNPNGFGAVVSLNIYGFVYSEYSIVTVDELSQILQFANLEFKKEQ